MKKNKYKTDVLIIGGGSAGVCAALQAARMGVKVMLVEETEWLGGMLSAAGVSAIDGNHHLPSGLWGEFRNKIYQHYGGPQAVETGWVSNTLFEPKIANQIFHAMLAEWDNIMLFKGYRPVSARIKNNAVCGAVFTNEAGQEIDITAVISIEATEYGDFLPLAGCKYITGRESHSQTGEIYAPKESDPAVQDLTYVAILRDYGPEMPAQMNRPANYDPEIFRGCCQEWCFPGQENLSSAERMLNYGRLPNDRFMINWPIKGNDYPGNLLELKREQRRQLLFQAKQKTLAFVYFIQNQLGFTHLGLDTDQFPTDDHLALIPYIRESRRIKGKYTLTVSDILNPAKNKIDENYIAVGDYPLDHHHMDKDILDSEKFPAIPAYGVPLGCLIPENTDGLLVAEKSISVSHIVNGCTRLQPVVMQIGQAAGAAAALCIQSGKQAANLAVRDVQRQLLADGVWLIPFSDISEDDPAFDAMQRTAVCGLIKGEGRPSGWENKFLIHPDQHMTERDVYEVLNLVGVKNSNIIALKDSLEKCHLDKFLILIWQAKAGERDTDKISKPVFDKHLLSQTIHYFSTNNLIADWIKTDEASLRQVVNRKTAMYLVDLVFNPFENLT
jgi:hypothetical protein